MGIFNIFSRKDPTLKNIIRKRMNDIEKYQKQHDQYNQEYNNLLSLDIPEEQKNKMLPPLAKKVSDLLIKINIFKNNLANLICMICEEAMDIIEKEETDEIDSIKKNKNHLNLGLLDESGKLCDIKISNRALLDEYGTTYIGSLIGALLAENNNIRTNNSTESMKDSWKNGFKSSNAYIKEKKQIKEALQYYMKEKAKELKKEQIDTNNRES